MEKYRELILLLFFLGLVWLIERNRITRLILYPLTLIVTFFHELGHAFAAHLSGGQAWSIRVHDDKSGVSTTAGGSRIVVLNAGYLGSIIFGFLMFCLPYTPVGDWSLMIIMGFLLIAMAFWVRDFFTSLLVLAVSALLIFLDNFCPVELKVFLVKFIGVCCVFYAWFRIDSYGRNLKWLQYGDVNGQHLETDAYQLSRITKIPAFIWVVLWRLISILVFLLMAKIALNHSTV